MKKFVDFFKNFAGVIKAIRFIAECLESFADIYQKYYPQKEETRQPENDSKEGEK